MFWQKRRNVWPGGLLSRPKTLRGFHHGAGKSSGVRLVGTGPSPTSRFWHRFKDWAKETRVFLIARR